MKKIVLVGILLMLVATVFVFSKMPTTNTTAQISDTKKQELTKLAQDKYRELKNKKVDMKNGPCLGPIAIGWVADVAHNPRQPVDDKPENQCSDVLTQKTTHFIELDPQGKFIRLQ